MTSFRNTKNTVERVGVRVRCRVQLEGCARQSYAPVTYNSTERLERSCTHNTGPHLVRFSLFPSGVYSTYHILYLCYFDPSTLPFHKLLSVCQFCTFSRLPLLRPQPISVILFPTCSSAAFSSFSPVAAKVYILFEGAKPNNDLCFVVALILPGQPTQHVYLHSFILSLLFHPHNSCLVLSIGRAKTCSVRVGQRRLRRRGGT